MSRNGEFGRLLGASGPLARVIEGFESRREPQLMADWVGEALASRGIDQGRLVAKGYGQGTPIADNKTEAGRQTNRRVEFKIVEKAAKGENNAK